MMDSRFKTDLAAARADAACAWEQVKVLRAAAERRGARGAPAEGAPALGLPGLGAAGAPELPRAGAASEPGGVRSGAPPARGPAAAERVEGSTQCDLTGEGTAPPLPPPPPRQLPTNQPLFSFRPSTALPYHSVTLATRSLRSLSLSAIRSLGRDHVPTQRSDRRTGCG